MLGDRYFSGFTIGRINWEDDLTEYPRTVARLYDIPLISMVIFAVNDIQQLVDIVEKGLEKQRVTRTLGMPTFDDAWRLLFLCANRSDLLADAYFGVNNECSSVFKFHLVSVVHLRDEYYGITVMKYV